MIRIGKAPYSLVFHHNFFLQGKTVLRTSKLYWLLFSVVFIFVVLQISLPSSSYRETFVSAILQARTPSGMARSNAFKLWLKAVGPKLLASAIVVVFCSIPVVIALFPQRASSSSTSSSSPDSCAQSLSASAKIHRELFQSKMPKQNTTQRLHQLRAAMKNLTVVPAVLHAYVIPTDDAHQNEYISAADQRRAYISGFTGSAGSAVVTENRAALWTDGRYFLQAAQELDENWVLVKDRLPDSPSFGQWLNEHTPIQATVGADPTTMSSSVWDTLAKDLESQGRRLVAVGQNLVDLVWEG